jgi:hypothetical protein
MIKNYLKSVLFALLLGISPVIFSQNVGINTTGTNPSSNAILDLNSGNKFNLGLIIPHVELSSSLTQFSPPIIGAATIKDTGMMVYNVSALYQPIGYYYWSGSTWVSVSGAASTGWTTTGNGGTNPAINYAGTSGPQDFVMRTTATERARITAAGGFGIGTPTPKSAMDVNGNMSIGTYAGVNAAPANGIIISGQVGIGTNAPNASAALDITSVTGGVLPPRMTAVQMNAIAAPATGLVVLNTTSNCLEYYSGTAWQNVVCPCSGPPATPGSITGSVNVCASSAGNVYTIATVANATSYNWTVPTGATITAGTGTTSITVTFGSTSGNITVSATNSCGTSGTSTLAVTVTSIPAAPAIPSGSTSPSVSSSYTYTIATVAGATSYVWTVSNSTLASITGGQGTTSATITNSATTGTYTICVYASNACGNSATSCLTVTSINCTHSTVTFSYSGAITTWTVPACITQITITAKGAQGGGSSTYALSGGLGASMQGTFTVAGGSVLSILVGGQGGTGLYQGGGGGGSFVCTSANAPLCIAGGGGGIYYCCYNYDAATNMPGSTATTGNAGIYGAGNAIGGAGGVSGGGGGVASQFTYDEGQGGAGLTGNGTNNQNTDVNVPTIPQAFINGGAGGGACYITYSGSGGFGGGGAADWCAWTGGGGGGGYSGGGGGTYYGVGGGGGSYNGGTAQTNTAGANAGNGSITIVY